jgi:hypothetical protein
MKGISRYRRALQKDKVRYLIPGGKHAFDLLHARKKYNYSLAMEVYICEIYSQKEFLNK